MSDPIPRRTNPAPLFLILGLVAGFVLGGLIVGGLLYFVVMPVHTVHAAGEEARDTLKAVLEVQPKGIFDMTPKSPNSGMGSDASRRVTIEFMENVRAGRAEAAFSKFTTNGFQSKHNHNPTGFKTMLDAAGLAHERTRPLDSEITALPDIDSKTHQHRVVLPRKSGGPATFTITLTESYSGWAVDAFKLEEDASRTPTKTLDKK